MVIFYDCTELAVTLCACLFARTECGPPTELAGWPDSLVQVQPHLDLTNDEPFGSTLATNTTKARKFLDILRIFYSLRWGAIDL